MTAMSTIMHNHAEMVAENYNSTATFTMASGATKSISANLEEDVSYQPSSMAGRAWGQTKIIEALLSDLTREPNIAETFKISGTTYTVRAIEQNDGYFVRSIVT